MVDCSKCVNRGVVNGYSQETYCSACIHSGNSWKQDYYDAGSACVIIGGSLNSEVRRTAEVLMDIMTREGTKGIYQAIQFLYDSSYDLDRIGKLLPYLAQEAGVKNK